MAIPKKRKKLDESTVQVKAEESPVQDQKPEIPEPNPQSETKKRATRVKKKHSESDVEKAFEVMEKLEETIKPSIEVEPSAKQLQVVRKVYTKDQSGLHVCFTIDAIQLGDFLKNMDNSKEEVKDYLEFDITIPYPWNWPVLNDITKIVISNLKEMKIIK
ncbi:MAG: hypothetical protein H7A25_12285 [Leptospiraceae bacterium]|nr:hypothetical protein [Leptospiraceae bacterium]MCP5500678.1 hypothetical protein [Leptospiraceae bacterium]